MLRGLEGGLDGKLRMLAQLLLLGVLGDGAGPDPGELTVRADRVVDGLRKRTLSKYPEERALIGMDWTILLDGAAIAGPLPDPVAPAGHALDFVELVGNMAIYWWSGGTGPSLDRLGFSAITSEGETLATRVVGAVRR